MCGFSLSPREKQPRGHPVAGAGPAGGPAPSTTAAPAEEKVEAKRRI